MATQNAPSIPTKRLAAAILSTDASFTLNNILDWGGVALTSADFGTRAFGCFRNASNTQIEFFEFDPSTIASSAITLISRGLDYKGGTTASVETKYSWPANTTLVELGANVPALFEQYLDQTSDQTISGKFTFPNGANRPIVDSDTDATVDTQFVTHGELTRTALAGANLTRVVISGVAGETISTNNVVYFKESDQRWWKADADAVATDSNIKLGIALGAGTAGVGITTGVALYGYISGLSGLTAGGKCYVSGTAGGIDQSLPTIPRLIGWAISTTTMMFCPDELDRSIISTVSGEALSIGTVVYFKESDGKWWKADADAAATAIGVKLGIVQTTTSAGDQLVLVRVAGEDLTQTSLTVGEKYYLSGTAGALTTTPGTFPRFVGYGLTANRLLLADQDPFKVSVFGQEIYAASTTGNDTYVVTLPNSPEALVAGFRCYFKVDTANTGAATLNVNGLGAKSILRPDGSALADGDIAANQIVGVAYDGTSMLMITPVANSPKYTNGTTTYALTTASGNQTIAHGLGRTPRYVRIRAILGTSSISASTNRSEGTYNGSSYVCLTEGTNNASGIGEVLTNAVVKIWSAAVNGSNYQSATVSWDATNITLAWTKTGAPTETASLIWEAES